MSGFGLGSFVAIYSFDDHVHAEEPNLSVQIMIDPCQTGIAAIDQHVSETLHVSEALLCRLCIAKVLLAIDHDIQDNKHAWHD